MISTRGRRKYSSWPATSFLLPTSPCLSPSTSRRGHSTCPSHRSAAPCSAGTTRSQRDRARQHSGSIRAKSKHPSNAHYRAKGECIMANLTHKTALVTGGSRGIGAAIAKRLAAEGASVAITYTKGADAAASVVLEIERAGRKAIAIRADAANANAVEAAVEKTVATFGGLDVLVNNAGTAIPKTFADATLEEMDRVIDINVRGTLVATQAALKYMKSGGRIIMIGSAVGERVLVPGLVAYAATKGA